MREFWKFVAEHHGVFSRSEAAFSGVSPEQIRRMLRNGEAERIAPATFRLASHSDSWSARARAASTSTSGVLSHRTAAALWGLDGFKTGRIEVTVDCSNPIRRNGITVHRSRQFGLVDEQLIEGLPVTGPARTVLDLFAVLRPNQMHTALDAALRMKLVDWADLHDVLAHHSAKGRDGCGKLRAFLEVRDHSASIPDSRWNRMVGSMLLDAGLPEPHYESTIRGRNGRFLARVDLAYPNAKLAIELDSVRWHMNHTSFEEDPRRKNKLLLEGWRVLTFTWADYHARPHELVRIVKSVLL